MINLRPCPFCGGDGKLKEFATHYGAGKTYYYVYCANEDCPVGPETGNEYTPEAAIAAWNTRYTDDDLK